MLTQIQKMVLALGLLAMMSVPALAEDVPTVEQQMAGLQSMCSESAKARDERHAEKPLWDRLGGAEKVAEMFHNVAARHRVNEPIKHFMDGVDDDMLVEHLVEFVSVGTGGGGKYTGVSMPEVHAHMKLTDADFLAAGGDIVAAMTEMKYGQNEIDEFLCILVSLKPQVVFK